MNTYRYRQFAAPQLPLPQAGTASSWIVMTSERCLPLMLICYGLANERANRLGSDACHNSLLSLSLYKRLRSLPTIGTPAQYFPQDELIVDSGLCLNNGRPIGLVDTFPNVGPKGLQRGDSECVEGPLLKGLTHGEWPIVFAGQGSYHRAHCLLGSSYDDIEDRFRTFSHNWTATQAYHYNYRYKRVNMTREVIDSATWYSAPLVIQNEPCGNIAHALREIMFTFTYMRRAACSGLSNFQRGGVVWPLASRKKCSGVPWISQLYDLVAQQYNAKYMNRSLSRMSCFYTVIQKRVFNPGTPHDRIALRDLALGHCAVEQGRAPRELILVLHDTPGSRNRNIQNVDIINATLRTLARSQGLQSRILSMRGLEFCDQVRIFYSARIVIGTVGSHIGGNLVFAHNDTVIMEAHYCTPQYGVLDPSPHFHYAEAWAIGYVAICLCVQDLPPHLQNSASYGDWFGRNLTLDPVMIAKVVNATLQSDFDYVADHTLPAC